MSEPTDDGFTAAYKQTVSLLRRPAERWGTKPAWQRWGSILLIVSGITGVVSAVLGTWFWYGNTLSEVFSSEFVRWFRDLTVFSGLCILVFAPRRHRGIAGDSPLAKAVVLAYAAAIIVNITMYYVTWWWYLQGPGAQGRASEVQWWENVSVAATMVVGLAFIVLGYLTASAGVVSGMARWVILAYIGYQLLLSVVTMSMLAIADRTGNYELAQSDIWWYLPVGAPVLLVAAGLAFFTTTIETDEIRSGPVLEQGITGSPAAAGGIASDKAGVPPTFDADATSSH